VDIRGINTKGYLNSGSLHVRIIKVNSPTLLWIQLYYAREDLEELLEDLSRRMARGGRGLIHNPDRVLPDEYIAVCEGKTWQREVVMSLKGRDTVGLSSIKRLGPCHLTPDHRYVHIGGSLSGDGLARHPVRACPSWPRRIKTQVAPEE